MFESLVITLLPALFLAVLFGGGTAFRRRQIDIDGDPPIDRRVFYASKYSIVVVWGAMVACSWGVPLSFMDVPRASRWVGLVLWVAGFSALFVGRFTLGRSFRLGSPKEPTDLRLNGLFRFSRNPMYLGVYATLAASVLYTLNPVVLAVGVFVVVVHHRIVLAEERFLASTFGSDFTAYCRRVRRYL
jgi:protein-S-isoprenylcysteine O-methyltransferase Ste14